MSFEDLLREELERIEEQFAPALNFYQRMTSRGSEIGPEGRALVEQARRDFHKLLMELAKDIYKLAEKDLQSTEHKDVLSRKGMKYADEVAKIVIERIFGEFQ